MVNDINKNTSLNSEVATLNKAPVDAILAVAKTDGSPLVTLSDEGVGLAAYPYPGGCNLYYIGWDRINSKGKLLRWILHLTDKTWFTQDMCRELIGAAISHFKWEMPQL